MCQNRGYMVWSATLTAEDPETQMSDDAPQISTATVTESHSLFMCNAVTHIRNRRQNRYEKTGAGF